jgi:hypothetical protein
LRNLPAIPVRYPAWLRYRCTVEVWSSCAWSPFVRTLLLWFSRPVMIAAREGQHSGVVANASVNVVPPCPNHDTVRGMCSSVSMARWSSVTMTRMFGGELCPAAGPDLAIGMRASAASAAAMRA